MTGDFVLLIFLVMLNLILIVRRIPLIGVPVGVFTIYISMAFFLDLETTAIPANPYTTFLLTIFAVSAIIAQGIELRKR